MKLFSTKQIAELDKYTIENEPIADVDLMERAAIQITNWLAKEFTTEQKIVVFAGPGNNGGDALAVARQITELGFICEVYLLDFGKLLKGSPAINWERLEKQGKVKLSKIAEIEAFPEINLTDVILDGMFGSGLNRLLKDFPAEIVQKINRLENMVVAIDIPSGLMGEDNSEDNSETIIRANSTLTLQFPKISFLFAENEQFIGRWEVLPINLHPEGIRRIQSNFYFIEKSDVTKIMPQRTTFQHKGDFGHALLIAGSFGKMGAAVLASKACLRSGVGLLTTHIPQKGYLVIQTAVPEAMASTDRHDLVFTDLPELKFYSAIGVGPGLDKQLGTAHAFHLLIKQTKVPLVIDADALNILSENRAWLAELPENSILTPHPGEFKRLVGKTKNAFEAVQKQLHFSKRYKVVVVLKGAFTTISTPSGKLYFNSTGNPGMATAGSGDVLTGIILGLLAQGFSSENAAVCGVYIHGLAGSLAAEAISQPALIAGDVVDFLGDAFISIKTHSTK
jgi:NAD(P)H-hydrate epimerase